MAAESPLAVRRFQELHGSAYQSGEEVTASSVRIAPGVITDKTTGPTRRAYVQRCSRMNTRGESFLARDIRILAVSRE